MSIGWEAAGGSHVGRVRRGNEDTFRVDAARGIFLVADGMGGHAAGEVASDLAASSAERVLAEALDAGAADGQALSGAFRQAFHAAYESICNCCRNDPRTRGMGTTLTACVLDRAGGLHIGHIGDSRLYRLRGGQLAQVTRDHTWVQREVDAGRIEVQAAAKHPLSHILTRVLSEDHEPELDLITADAVPGDLILLATDGLYNMVGDDVLASLLTAAESLDQLTRSLIGAANRAGGADNVTVVLVRVLAGG